MMMDFTSQETEKIAGFFYRVANSHGDFRQNVLEAFYDIFGYKRVSFWLTNPENIVVNPEYIGIDNEIMYAYAVEYYKHDPMDYLNLKKLQKQKAAALLTDIIDEKEYLTNNLYFKDILSKYKYRYKMVIWLKVDAFYLGAMSFLRREGETPFSDRDRAIIDVLGRYIARLLMDKQTIERMKSENDIQMEFIDYSGDGLVITDRKCQIHFINQAATDIINQLISENKITSLCDIVESLDYQVKNVHSGDFSTRWDMDNIAVYAREKNIGNDHYYNIILKNKNMKEPQKILSLTPGILKLSDTFTHREKEIINCVLLGLSNREIASELFISENTVKTHLYNIYQKYGVRNRTSLLHKLNHKP